ncbi:tail fiber protein, partial [Escherichia coli]|uniref:phage tail protein n=1 Tax=Escherichia coli TaxID=562 RepID=UPI0021A691F6
SLTVKGTVQLSSATNSTSETQAATPKAVKAAYDLAAGKAPVSHTHPWSQITDVPAASLTVKGTVQLSSATNSTSETQAATPKAVKAVYDLANGKQPADATLTALAGLATAADKLPYFTGNDTASLTTLTNVGRNILDKASTQAVIQYLGLSDASGYVGRWLNTRVFTSSGTYTPTPGTKRIRVTITGGGGGGGGCKATSNNETFFGAGGGAGGTIISIMTPTQNSYPVTIGAGGAGGVSATNGTSGGNSVFASLIAPGGAGGGKVGVTNTNGGNGGVPNIGDIRITGGNGGDGQSGNISVSGEGGASYWGGGGRAGAGGGVRGRAFGSGGGGAYDAGYSGTSMTGGKGADGVCILEEFA